MYRVVKKKLKTFILALKEDSIGYMEEESFDRYRSLGQISVEMKINNCFNYFIIHILQMTEVSFYVITRRTVRMLDNWWHNGATGVLALIKNGQYNYLLLTIIIKYRYTFCRLVLYVSLIEFDSDAFTDEDGTIY